MSQQLKYASSIRNPNIEATLRDPVISEVSRKTNNRGSIVRDSRSIFMSVSTRSRSARAETIEELAERTAAHYEQGNWSEAIDGLGKLKQLRPSSSELYLLLGMAYLSRSGLDAETLSRDDLNRAANALEKAVKLNPNNAKAQFHLATAYIAPFLAFGDESKLRKAIKPVKKAIQLGHHVPQAHLYLGTAYSGLGNWQAAEENYLKAIELDPTMDAAYLKLADLYKLLGDQNEEEREDYYLRAIAVHNKLLEIDPEKSDAHNFTGMYYRELGRLEDALEAYEEAVRINSNDLLSLINLGTTYLDVKRFDEAKSSFEQIIQTNARTIAAYLGRKFGNRDDTAKFRADAYTGYGVACMEMYHSQLNTRGGEATSEPDSKLLQEAETALKKAIELYPKHINAHYDLAVLCYRQQRLPEAEKIVHRLLEIDPDSEIIKKYVRSLMEEQLKRKLHEDGLLKRVREPISDFRPYQNRRLAVVHGRPVSETLVEDRR
jgi:tetratricopeptide (TPR) repeat protein